MTEGYFRCKEGGPKVDAEFKNLGLIKKIFTQMKAVIQISVRQMFC